MNVLIKIEGGFTSSYLTTLPPNKGSLELIELNQGEKFEYKF